MFQAKFKNARRALSGTFGYFLNFYEGMHYNIYKIFSRSKFLKDFL